MDGLRIDVSFPLIGIILVIGFAASIRLLRQMVRKIFATGPRTERPKACGKKSRWLYRSTLGALLAAGILMSFGVNLVANILSIRSSANTIHLPSGAKLYSLTTGLELSHRAGPDRGGPDFLGLGFILRPNRPELTQAYTGGEDPVFDLSGLYYADEKPERKMTLGTNVVAALLLIALISLPVALEVFK